MGILRGWEGSLRKAIIVVVTVAILAAYGHLLSWAWDNGLWWVFGLGAVATIWLCLKLSTPEEKAGYRRFWANLLQRPRQTDDRP